MAGGPRAGIRSDLLREIDLRREGLLAFLAKAVRAASVTGAEGPAADVYASCLSDSGFETYTRTVEPALRDRFPNLRSEVDLERRPSVFAWWRSDNPRAAPLVLNGHIDVVPEGPESAWTEPPFSGRRRDGKLWGRGAADMKAGLAAAIFALCAVRDSGVELPFDVQLQCVIGEETGGLGTLSALATEPRPGAAVVLEPTECRVASASGGVVQFTVRTTGVPAHTAVPWTGTSAMEKLWVLYDALNAFATRRNASIDHPLFESYPAPAPFAMGSFSAGGWRSNLPGNAEMSGRIGVMPGETIAEVQGLILDVIQGACGSDAWLRDHPAETHWIHEGLAAWETPASTAVVRCLHESRVAVCGEDSLVGVTYASDAGHFQDAGIPTVLFGPGNIADAHAPDEFVDEAQVVQATKVLALFLLRYASYALPEA